MRCVRSGGAGRALLWATDMAGDAHASVRRTAGVRSTLALRWWPTGRCLADLPNSEITTLTQGLHWGRESLC